jgi:hypothetical protein
VGDRDHSEECPFCHVWHGGLNDTPCGCVEGEGVVQRANDPGGDSLVFTEAALAANDGKTVPLRLEPGGPIVGEATMHYDSGEKALTARYRVADPRVAELLKGDLPNIFGQER